MLSPTGAESSEGERPGVRMLGVNPENSLEITLRSGRFGDYVQEGEAEKARSRSRAARRCRADLRPTM